jgi:NitT/TauT family transport system permease protein
MPDAARAAQNLRLRFLGALGVLILLAGWAAASLAAGSFFVPAPWTTVADTVVLLFRAGTWTQILITFLRVCVGFLAGLTAGIAAGIAIGARRETAALLKPLVLFFQGMPPLLWAIPLVALMGIGHLPTIIVITLITFPLVAVTIGEGMSTLPRDLGEMLAVFAPGFAARTRELVLPHLAPFLGAAVNTGLVLAVKASVTAEYFGANDGIGFQIQAAYMSLRIRSLFSWAAVLILLILLFTSLLPRIRRALAAARTLARGKGPLTCSVEDVKELKRQFVSRGSAAHTGPRGGTRRIVLDRVSFSYRRQAEKSAALRGVDAVIADADLTLKPGEIGVLTGESGIGKTTLLKLAASLLRPSSGKVTTPQRIGYVFQDDRLLPWRSVA